MGTKTIGVIRWTEEETMSIRDHVQHLKNISCEEKQNLQSLSAS